jgi:hypothetical protein
MYAVDLDIAAKRPQSGAASGESTGSLYSILIDHLITWLGAGHVDLTPAALALPGSATLPVDPGGDGQSAFPREASWDVAGNGSTRALQFDLRVPLAGENAWFVNRLTISEAVDEPTRLRVTMGREVTSGWLVPTSVQWLRRPGIVRQVVVDPRLLVTTLGQPVDGRYAKLYEEEDVPDLIAAAECSQRLPLLVARPLDDQAWNFVGRAATELAGLARVVCLASKVTLNAFNDRLPNFRVSPGGARLLWPALEGTRHPDYPRIQLETQDPADLVQRIMRMLAPLSVVARGLDAGWEAARRASHQRDASLAAQRLQAAQASGDRDTEVAALRERITDLEAQLQKSMAAHDDLELEVNGLQAAAGEAQQALYNANYWKAQYLALAAGQSSGQDVQWEDAPELEPNNAQPLFDFLERASGGACRFTANAATSWRRSGYPFADSMRDSLIRLARASLDFSTDPSVRRLSARLKRDFGLGVTLRDTTLEEADLSKIIFEGNTLSRAPHVTLDDQGEPKGAGRIHFACEPEARRFIVDHVGFNPIAAAASN